MGSLGRELAELVRRSGFLDRREPFLYLIALINEFLEERGLGRAIIVGGYAVELYTGGAYRTGDVDIVVEGAVDVVKEALNLLGRRVGRMWVLDVEGLAAKAVDIASRLYDRPKPPVEVRVEGLKAYVEPPEEAVIS